MAKKKIQYQDKERNNGSTTNGIFTYQDANELKEVINNNADMLHDHGNKSVIDNITDANINAWNNAVLSAHTHNNKVYLDKINQDLSISASPSFSNLTVENTANLSSIRTTEISSPSFISGFGGEGFRLAKNSNGDYSLEVQHFSHLIDMDIHLCYV